MKSFASDDSDMLLLSEDLMVESDDDIDKAYVPVQGHLEQMQDLSNRKMQANVVVRHAVLSAISHPTALLDQECVVSASVRLPDASMNIYLKCICFYAADLSGFDVFLFLLIKRCLQHQLPLKI